MANQKWTWPAGRVLILYEWSWFDPDLGDVVSGWSRQSEADDAGYVHFEAEGAARRPNHAAPSREPRFCVCEADHIQRADSTPDRAAYRRWHTAALGARTAGRLTSSSIPILLRPARSHLRSGFVLPVLMP